MDIKKFQKKVEDFTCEHCGAQNKGDGFTNHCSKCLTSKHVDIFPGDRKETCGGLMPVSSITKKGDRYVLRQKCLTCGYVNGDHLRSTDDFDALIDLSKKLSEKHEKK